MIRTLFVTSLLLCCATPLQGQKDPLIEEVGLFAAMGSSDNPEFPSPVGFGVRSTWNFNRHWLFRLSLQRMEDESRKMGIVCKSYAPHIICRPTVTDNTATLTEVRGGLLRTVILGGVLRVGFGGGLSFNMLDADSRADDGRRADLLAPKTGQVGYLANLSADLILHPRIPVRLSGGLTSHWVQFHICSGAEPPQYDPFCTMSQFKEAELGLSVAF